MASEGEGKPQKLAITRHDGEKINGKVKTWVVDKGFGFFECEDGGEDIFMHQSAIKLAESKFRAIAPETQVTITFLLRDGKATCSEITLRDGSPLPGFESKLIATQTIDRIRNAPAGAMFGKCKWFNAEKGFGFIVPDNGTEDVFVNIKDVEGGHPLSPDEPLSYVLIKQADGRDRASKVRASGGGLAPMPQYYPPQAYNPYGQQGMPYPYSQQYGGPPHAGAGNGAPSAAMRGGTKAGTVKWFNEERGFGFIIPSSGGTEVYFRASAIVGGGSLMDADPVDYEEKHAGGKSWACTVVSTKNRKRKAGAGGFEAYGEPPANMFKAQRQGAYQQAPPPGGRPVGGNPPHMGAQYDPYGVQAQAGAPGGTGQYPQYAEYPAQYPASAGQVAPNEYPRPPAGYEAVPPAQSYYGQPPYY